LIGLDATALVCRFQRQHVGETPNVTEGRRRTTLLARHADLQNEPFAIPAPALAEFLIGLPADENSEAMAAIMSRQFRIIPFDGLAAQKTAELWRKLDGDYGLKRLVDEIGYTRQMFKIDLQIVGCTISRQARLLVTGDRGVRAICQRIGLLCYLACDIPESEFPSRPAVGASPGLFEGIHTDEDDDDTDEEEDESPKSNQNSI
jgi:hypothetical protein